jgi:hypothetical protein
MLKKSIPGFFNYDLDEVNSSKSHKLLDFSNLTIWQSVHGLPRRVFFNTLLIKEDYRMPFTKKTFSCLIGSLAPLLLVSLALLAQGCATEKKAVRPYYPDVLKEWTRGVKIYYGLEPRLYINATYKNRAFRDAYLDRYAESYRLDEEYKQAMQDREFELSELYNEFLLSAYTPDETWNDFDKKDSVWRLYLVDSAGAKLSPISVKKVDVTNPLLREFFPYVDLWSSAYIARFPKYSEAGTEPIPGKDTEFIKLLVVGVLGNGEIEWRLTGR